MVNNKYHYGGRGVVVDVCHLSNGWYETMIFSRRSGREIESSRQPTLESACADFLRYMRKYVLTSDELHYLVEIACSFAPTRCKPTSVSLHVPKRCNPVMKSIADMTGTVATFEGGWWTFVPAEGKT